MHPRLRALFVVSAVLSLAACDKSTPPPAAETVPVPVVAPVTSETDNQLAEARDALQRQALEIETKSALMDKQLADMEQALKDRENAELRGSLDTLKQQNEALRVQADAARRQSDAITQRIAVTPPPLNAAPLPPAVVLQPDYSLFYDQLAPYGRWFDVSGYGYCWRPTITVAGWRPYVDGCWVWSSLGWAWQSNEAFGWATYHYGRWVNLSRYGWVWVPGSEWAPAWVAWRQSRDCVGWAPLPPEQGICNGVYRDCDSRYGLGPTSYTFINTNQFVSSSYISIYAPVTQQTTIFQHSVNVTQIVPRSGHGHGHAFVNQGGPPRGQMEQACGRPVPQRQVQTVRADQVPEQQSHHQRGGHREAAAPVAMVELPTVTPGTRMRHPEIKEHIQRPAVMGGFEGVPQRVATEIRETIAKEKETAAVQQHQPVHGRMPHGSPRRPGGAPSVANVPPVLNAPPQETVRPGVAVENSAQVPVVSAPPASGAVAEQTRPAQTMEHRGEHHRGPNAATQPPLMPAVVEPKAAERAVGAVPATEPGRTESAVVVSPPAGMPQTAAEQAPGNAAGEQAPRPFAAGDTQGQGAAMQHRERERRDGQGQQRGMAERQAAEQATAADAEKARQQAAAQQQAEATAQQQRMAAEQTAAETEKARQQAEATAQQQRMAAEQTASENEKARQQAEATAQQQRMAAEQAAAMQQQQELAAQQQRAAAERMANEQAAAAEASRAQQAQAEAAAMQQRQQEEVARRAAAEEQQMRAQQEAAQQRAAQEMAQRQAAEEQARRVAEEQQMRAQQEAVQRAQEMAQRQAEEARRQQEAEMQRAQEQARQEQMRAQQEAAQRAQEMAQRQAEEQARRQQEEMQRAQEQARQEQMRAQQEAAQRAAQEMAQRQAEEQARRAQEEAQRAAAEAAQRAAAGNGAGGR